MLSRTELLRPVLDAAGTRDASVFDGWEVVPGFIDGTHAATAVVNGTEVHFAVVPALRRRAINRRRAQEFVAPLLERHGFLTTRVRLTSESSKQFVERVGFKPTWSDGFFQYYLLGHLPFARS